MCAAPPSFSTQTTRFFCFRFFLQLARLRMDFETKQVNWWRHSTEQVIASKAFRKTYPRYHYSIMFDTPVGLAHRQTKTTTSMKYKVSTLRNKPLFLR